MCPTSEWTSPGFLVVLSLVLFLFFLDRFIHRLRPVAVAGLVGRMGRKVIASVSEVAEADTVRSISPIAIRRSS